jgi:hypothetical protein
MYFKKECETTVVEDYVGGIHMCHYSNLTIAPGVSPYHTVTVTVPYRTVVSFGCPPAREPTDDITVSSITIEKVQATILGARSQGKGDH